VKYIHSLTFKLIAIGVLLVLAGSSIRYLLMEKTLKSGIEEVVNAQQYSLAKYVAQDIDHKVQARRQALLQLAADMPQALLHSPAQMETWLRVQSAALNLFPAGVVVVDANGVGAIADYPAVAGRRQLDFNDRDWFIATRGGADFAVGKPGIGRAVQEAVVNMAVPVRDARQHVVAVVMGVTPLAAPGFLNLVETGNVGKTGGFLLISPRDQIFVTSSEASMRLKPLPPPGANPLHDQAMGGWRGTGITHNAKGSEELSAVVSIPSANWFLVARTPSAEAFQVVNALLTAVIHNSLRVSVVLMLSLVLLLLYLFRPLKQAAAQMRAMAQGQRALAHLPVVRKDEVGAMVTSFNELVDKLLQSESRMRYLAHHDALTSLHNRMSFQQSLAQSVALASRQDGSLALLFIDLDGFKAVNDTFGHDVGDQLLVQVAARLQACVRASDVVGRLGGDEFVLLLTDNPNAEQAAHIADKVIAAIQAPYGVPHGQPELGASIGIALYPQQANTADQLLNMADTAMYVAKRAGGSRHHGATI
jgi:diguanylate cyclase (GGDEF)-like protein